MLCCITVAHVSTIVSGIVLSAEYERPWLKHLQPQQSKQLTSTDKVQGTISHKKLATDFIMPELSYKMGLSVLLRSLVLCAPSFIPWDPRRKHRASAPRMAILKKINITSNVYLFHSWQKGRLLCCIPASMGFLKNKLTPSSC